MPLQQGGPADLVHMYTLFPYFLFECDFSLLPFLFFFSQSSREQHMAELNFI